MTASALMTAEDLQNLPSDHQRHELVKGELTTLPPTGDEHGARTFQLTVIVGAYIRTHQLGTGFGAETGFLLERDPDTVRAPDFAFITKARIARQGLTGRFYPGAPDLAVEVLSPSDSASEMLVKIREWLAAGTRLVWIVDPRRSSSTSTRPPAPRRPSLEGTLDGEDVLPGLQLPVAEIFR